MRKILIVDDDPAIRRMLGFNFRSHGYDPLGAANGLQAEKILIGSGSDIECVITDINMPLLGGWELLERLRRIRNDLPVILMALHDWYGMISKKQGAYSFWLKSDQLDSLLWGTSEVMKKKECMRKIREFNRVNRIGKLIIFNRNPALEAVVYNISEGGVMFEADKKVALVKQFSACLQFQGSRIAIKRLALVWNSSNGSRDLFGAKIEDIDLANELLMRQECNDDR
jgi:response regulator RpfG family c-di-GMP phosphodiesterase